MTTTFRLNTDELDATFIERVTAAFPHRQIEITVSEPDETDLILANPEWFPIKAFSSEIRPVRGMRNGLKSVLKPLAESCTWQKTVRNAL